MQKKPKARPVNWKSWVIVGLSSLVIVVFQNCDGKISTLMHQKGKLSSVPQPGFDTTSNANK